MLTSIRTFDKAKVSAALTEKCESPFACPICRSETILKKGYIKIAHFAHKATESCQFGMGESEHHTRCKQEIYDAFCQDKNLYCELEKDLGRVVPDVYVESLQTKRKYAIEVQISTLTIDKIVARTREYNRLGVYVLWLPVFDDKLKGKRYSPAAWEKWLHCLYFGRVYYWKSGLTVIPVHFDEYKLYVEETDFGGGYWRCSKRYRTPRLGKELVINKSFKPADREYWVGGDFVVPNCKILTDTLNRWWV